MRQRTWLGALCALLIAGAAQAQGVNINRVNGATVGGTEDAAETAGTGLFMAGCVRRDAPASSAGTDGDNATCNLDALGKLWVSGTYVEDAAETAAAALQMCGAVRRDAAASSSGTDGDNSTMNTDALGKLWVTGSYVEDAAETAAAALSMCGSVRRDTAASSAGTTGDNATVNTDADGKLWTTGSYTEDAAETAGGQLVMVGAVRRDTLASSSGTDGDNSTLNTNAVGSLYTITTGAAAIVCGNTDVPATGTAVQLGANAAKEVVIGCPAANTSPCYVRGSAGNGVTGGMVIPKGTGGVVLKVNNTNLLWVDAGTNGDDVTWCATN